MDFFSLLAIRNRALLEHWKIVAAAFTVRRKFKLLPLALNLLKARTAIFK